MYKLFIDDERNPSQVKWIDMPLGPWIIVRNYDAFVDYITKNGIPTHISFDHDLGESAYEEFSAAYNSDKIIRYENIKEKTGYDCLKYLISRCDTLKSPIPNCTFHTMNPIGKENMEKYLECYLKNAQER